MSSTYSTKERTRKPHTASRPKSTTSDPSTYFSAFTNPYGGTTSTRSERSERKERRRSSRTYDDPTQDRSFTKYLPGFGIAASSSSTSAYKRSPRSGFFTRIYSKIRRYIRDFIRYARKHPFKVLVPLIMAVMGSGALAGLVKRMGGLKALGLGGLGGFAGKVGGLGGLDRWINAGHGVRQGYSEGFAGSSRGEKGGGEGWFGNSGIDGVGMAKGAVKVVSAFL